MSQGVANFGTALPHQDFPMNHQTASAPGTPGTRHARRPVRAVRAAVVLAAFALAAAACGTSDDDDADAAACDTVGYVMYGAESSPGNDSDWDTLIHTAAVATAESTGTEALFERNVAGGTLFLPAVDRLVDQGACIVFATSADYIFAVDEAAERRPDVRFLNAGGFNEWSDDSPFGVYDARMYEARFLHGVIAAGNSPSGTVGYVASTDAPEVYRGLNFFALGARFVDPDVRVLVEWTGDW
ncbi:MAG TPA: hypothetical protein DEP66_05640, partial [Acidimicrobiaceae bacterium]|nr:hypothetical protein [Acidimicrobiaceae bacterium]